MSLGNSAVQSSPQVSVVLPVYNGAAYLRQTVAAILGQTFGAFECICIDDGSVDDSMKIIEEFADQRVRLYANESNRGISFTTNRGLDLARGEYVALVDQDDLSAPDRLAAQVAFLEAHPEVDICGTAYTHVGKRKIWRYPSGHEDIDAEMLFKIAMRNPSVMLRRRVVTERGLRFDEGFVCAADYDFFERAAASNCRLANLPQPLLAYRLHGANTSATRNGLQMREATVVRQRALRRLLDNPTHEDLLLQQQIVERRYIVTRESLQDVRSFFNRLRAANEAAGRYDPQAFDRIVMRHWGFACSMAAPAGVLRSIGAFLEYAHELRAVNAWQKLRVIVRCCKQWWQRKAYA